MKSKNISISKTIDDSISIDVVINELKQNIEELVNDDKVEEVDLEISVNATIKYIQIKESELSDFNKKLNKALLFNPKTKEG